MPGFFLQLTQCFSKYILNSFIKQGMSVLSSTSSAEPGSHNSKLNESFSTPTFLSVESSYMISDCDCKSFNVIVRSLI